MLLRPTWRKVSVPAPGGHTGTIILSIDIRRHKAPGIIKKSIFCLLTAVAETLTACNLPVTNGCLGWRSLRQQNGIKQLPDDTFFSLPAAAKLTAARPNAEGPASTGPS